MSRLAQLHHTTVRFSAWFANPLSKTVSDSCRNIACIPTYSLIIMFDIKCQMPGITLCYLCPFIYFFNGRCSLDYNWNCGIGQGKIYHPFNSDSLRVVKECKPVHTLSEQKISSGTIISCLFVLGTYSSLFTRKLRLPLFMHKKASFMDATG